MKASQWLEQRFEYVIEKGQYILKLQTRLITKYFGYPAIIGQWY